MVTPVVRGDRVRLSCTAAAASAVRPILDAHPEPGRILGHSGCAAWIAVAADVVVVATIGAVRLPNGVALGLPSGRAPLGLGASHCTVGDGRILLPDADVRVVRWWESRPALPCTTRDLVLDTVGALRHSIEVPADAGLGRALADRDPGAALVAALTMLGLGDGLTPAGDDLIAAALAACVLIGGALGDPSAVGVVDALAGPLGRAARDRTTSLSASLLRHACRGEVADPAAGLLRALAGLGDPVVACDILCGVGHSSGPALAAGTLIGAAAAAGWEMP